LLNQKRSLFGKPYRTYFESLVDKGLDDFLQKILGQFDANDPTLFLQFDETLNVGINRLRSPGTMQKLTAKELLRLKMNPDPNTLEPETNIAVLMINAYARRVLESSAWINHFRVRVGLENSEDVAEEETENDTLKRLFSMSSGISPNFSVSNATYLFAVVNNGDKKKKKKRALSRARATLEYAQDVSIGHIKHLEGGAGCCGVPCFFDAVELLRSDEVHGRGRWTGTYVLRGGDVKLLRKVAPQGVDDRELSFALDFDDEGKLERIRVESEGSESSVRACNAPVAAHTHPYGNRVSSADLRVALDMHPSSGQGGHRRMSLVVAPSGLFAYSPGGELLSRWAGSCLADRNRMQAEWRQHGNEQQPATQRGEVEPFLSFLRDEGWHISFLPWMELSASAIVVLRG
jgi:hypothetical protein